MVKGHDLKTNADIERKPTDEEPFTALAFKIATDPFVGRLCFFRVYAGHLDAGSYVLNARTGNKERVGRIVRMKADDREEVKDVFAGDICALVGPKDTFTGDTLCDVDKPIQLERIKFADPVISMSIEPKTKADQEKMGIAFPNWPKKIRLSSYRPMKKPSRPLLAVWENCIWKSSSTG